MERRVILGTAGHIDHGKTALVRALTGVDTDRLPEEKRRGITIDLGFAPLAIDGVGTIGVVDVPGHEAFVRTMLAGATGIDLALLVIAADEGVMPQTREHVAILDLLGVRTGVVALTKRDLVDDEWLTLVAEDARALLAGSGLARAPLVPVSSVTGAGLDALRAAIADTARSIPERDADDLFRMPIDRAFTVKGTGTVVTGTVWSGALRRDATVRLLPAGRAARVRAIQSHGASIDVALPGRRVAIALAGVELDEVGRGTVVVADPVWQPTRALRAEVALLDDADVLLGARTRVRLHLGTSEVGARVVTRAGTLAPGMRAAARVVLDEPVVARAGDRFVLRSASPVLTIGGGLVVDPLPPGRRARPLEGEAVSREPAARLEALLAEQGAHGLEPSSLAVRIGVRPRELAALLDASPSRPRRIGERLYPERVVEEARERARAAVAAFHERAPLEPGMPRQALRGVTGVTAEVADEALRADAAAGLLEVEGSLVRQPGWTPRLGEAERALRERLLAVLRQAGREPPSVPELTAEHGALVGPLLRLLEREGVVVAVEEERCYAAEAVASLVASLEAGMERGRAYGPSELREVLGVSRKFLIPFLEWCDQRGITIRRDEGRVWIGTQLAHPPIA